MVSNIHREYEEHHSCPHDMGPRDMAPHDMGLHNVAPLGGRVLDNVAPLGGRALDNVAPLGGRALHNMGPHHGRMEEVEENTLGDRHIGCQIDLKNQRMTLALSKVFEVWAGMEAQSQQP